MWTQRTRRTSPETNEFPHPDHFGTAHQGREVKEYQLKDPFHWLVLDASGAFVCYKWGILDLTQRNNMADPAGE